MKNQLVFGESISQVNQYITNQSVDLALTASGVQSKIKTDGNWVSIPKEFYPTIEQGMVRLKKSEGDHSVKNLENFILSKRGKFIFEKYGYDS